LAWHNIFDERGKFTPAPNLLPVPRAQALAVVLPHARHLGRAHVFAQPHGATGREFIQFVSPPPAVLPSLLRVAFSPCVPFRVLLVPQLCDAQLLPNSRSSSRTRASASAARRLTASG